MGIGRLASGALWLHCAGLAGTVAPRDEAIVAGADAGGNTVKLIDAAGGTPFNFSPYAAGYSGGVRVATGDLTGDGTPDIVVAPGPGAASRVRVFNGATGALFDDFTAYPASFAGGVYVAAGDVNGDGRADIITGAGPAVGGTPHVKVFDGRTGAEIRSFLAYGPTFAGGVTVAVADISGDGRVDIITGAASAASAHVKVFDGRTGAEVRSFFAYAAGFTGGVFVAGGDYNGDGRADVVTGANAGGAPHVKVFDGVAATEIASFFAYTAGFTGGVRVAAGDVNGDGLADIITGPGAGAAPAVARFLGPNAASGGSFLAFDAGFTGGVFVSAAVPMRVAFRDGFEDD